MADDLTAVVAVLSSQMGSLQHAVDGTLKDHGRRLTVLEEKEIRRQEREATEDRIRDAIQSERVQEQTDTQAKRSFSISKVGLWVAILTAAVLAVGTALAIAQFASS
jgi:cell division protein FtsX